MVASSIVTNIVVSASDVTPTDRWLNIWCIWHTKSGNTSGVSKSSLDWLNYTGFPGDVCVAFFNVPPGNKDAVTPNPLTKEESHRVYNGDDKRLSGSNKRWIFTKVCEIFKIRSIESFKYVREFYTPILCRYCVIVASLLLWRHFHTPKRDAEQSELWLVVCHVSQTASNVPLLCYCGVTVIVATFPHPETWRWTKRTVISCLSCRSNGLKPSSHQSEGLAMRDYQHSIINVSQNHNSNKHS